MGTEIQVKSNLLRHYSTRDLNDNSNICSWPRYPGDNMLPNGHYYNGYFTRAAAEVYPALGKDIVRQTMLDHEAIFRKQVLELHHLYTKQKELMSELRRKEMLTGRMPFETSLASSPLASQITSEDVAKWHSPSLPLVNSSFILRPFASVPEGIQSPASSSRVNSMQATDVQCPNGLGVNSSDILESTRPSKVRRKLFDLQLPANQYIDDGNKPERVKDYKFPEILATPPKEDARAKHRNGVILAGDGWRIDKEGQISGSRLYFGVRRVADLNEPLEIDDEASGSEHVKPHGNSLAQSSNLGSCNDISSSHSVIAADNGRGWLSIVEAGEGKGKKSVSQGDQMQKSLLSEVATVQSQLGRSKERRIHGIIDTTESDNCQESVRPSHLSPCYMFGSPPDPAKLWSKSVTNLERLGSCNFNQKMPFQNGPLETTSVSYMKVQQLGGNQRGSSDKRQFQSELPYQYGFHPGSSSSILWEPPCQLRFTAYDHYAYRSEDFASKELVQGRNDAKHHRLSGLEVRSATRLVDLNATLVNFPSGGPVNAKKTEDHPKIQPWLRSEADFSKEAAVRQVDLNTAPLVCLTNSTADKEKKMDDRPKILPWLKLETGFRDEDSVRASSTCTESRKNEAGTGPEGNKMLSWSTASVSCSDNVETSQNSRGRCPSDKRILEFRVSEKGIVSDNDRKIRLLDINLPCDSVFELSKSSSAGSFVSDKGNDLKVSRHIDLNLVVSEDEAYGMPCVSSKRGKRIPEIDLEAPAVPEEFGEENDQKSCRSIDVGMTSAAEAMMAILSSAVNNRVSLNEICSLTGCREDPLNWFADVALSCLNDVETRPAAVEEIDDFESMTLKLTETKLEDYLPKPFVPDIPKEDESAANLISTRPRRGPARRGRQRRDFQRDILPGLASLSRHEVTEDLQTFGGLMRATGHAWRSGMTRRNSRNSSTRGRRQTSATSQTTRTYAPSPVGPQPSVVDAGIEDRSLTSWGKITRRPRRQRCPAGNPQSIPVMQS